METFMKKLTISRYNNTFISNTYVLCLSETASQIRPTIDAVPGRLSSANGGASRDTTPRASPRPRGLSSPPLRPLSSSPKGVEGRPPSINIKLCGGQATAIVVPDVEGNWVRSDILKRMTAPPRRKSDGDIRRRRKAIFRNYSFESTGNFLELKCHRDKSLGSCRHRFYITDDQVGFDVLLGTDMLTTGATTAGVLNGISAGPMLTPGKSQTAPDTGNHNAQQKVLAWMNGVG
ncbi:hypothetical protein N431DRAFT_429464 [Stipitochalara longipes BDJ]|nr:hypothetical protein N431DRAFT_429464 [Stipitochalara longipes BDJ]